MLFEVGCIVAFAVITALLYMLSVAGTKETSFEDAVAKQRARNRLENPEQNNNKIKKTKVGVKSKATGRKSRSERSSYRGKKDSSPTTQLSDTSSSDDEEPQQQLVQEQQEDHEKIREAAEAKEQAKREQELRKKEDARKREEEQKLKQEQENKKKLEQQQRKKEQQERQRQEESDRQAAAAAAEKQRQEEKNKRKQKKASLINGETAEESDSTATESPALNGGIVEKKVKAMPEIDEMLLDAIDYKVIKIASSTTNATAPSATNPPAQSKKQNKSEKGGVRSVLDSVEKAQLSSDQIQTVVNSLLAIASEGGWSETRKTADSANLRKLEEANATIVLQEEAKNALTTKINSLRSDLNVEKSKVNQLKQQIETGVAEKEKALAKEKTTAADLQTRLQQTQEERNTLLRECEEKMRQVESRALGGEEAQQQLQQQHNLTLHKLQQTTDLNSQLQFQAESLAQDKTNLESRLAATVEAHNHNILSLEQERDQLSASLAAISPSVEQAAEAEKRLAEVQVSLQDQLGTVSLLTAEVAQLQGQLSHASTKQEELIAENIRVLEALTDKENLLLQKTQSSADEVQQMDEQYRQMLLRLHPSVTVDSALEYSAFMQKFESAAAAEAQKRSESPVSVEYVEKIVEKVVADPEHLRQIEELTLQNSSLSEKLSSVEASLEKEQTEWRERSERLAAESACLAEKNARLEQEKADQAATSHQDADMQAQNLQLQEQVCHYKTVLDNTEGLLRSLEASVEGAEVEWKRVAVEKGEQLASKETQLADLTKQLDEVKTKLAQLDEMKAENLRLHQQIEDIKKEKEGSSSTEQSD